MWAKEGVTCNMIHTCLYAHTHSLRTQDVMYQVSVNSKWARLEDINDISMRLIHLITWNASNNKDPTTMGEKQTEPRQINTNLNR